MAEQSPWSNGNSNNNPIGINNNNGQWNNNSNKQWKQENNNINSSPEQNDGGLSQFLNAFDMSQFDMSSIQHLIASGNDDQKMQDNSPIRMMDVSELEKVHNAEKAALDEKEEKALLQLEEYLDHKVNALIEIGKHHIDTMEGYIESLILSKLSCKVIEQCSEKCRSHIMSILQSIWTPELKKQLLQSMQVQLKGYMVQVAKVYDVGLTHFKEHTYEAQSIAGLNTEKIKQLCHELLCLQGVDSDVVKDLSEQCDSEYEELKNAKEITDMVGKQMGVLNAFKDKHSALDNAVDSLTSQYLQKKQLLQNHIQKSVNEAIQREISMQYVMKLKQQQQQQAMMFRQQQLLQQQQQQQQQSQQQQQLIPNFWQPQLFNGQNAAASSNNNNNNSGDIGNLNLFGLNSMPSWLGMNVNQEEQSSQIRDHDRQDEQGDILEDAEEEEKQEYYQGEDDEQDEDNNDDEEDEDGHDMNELDGESGSPYQQQQQQQQVVSIAHTTEEEGLGQQQQGQANEESNEKQEVQEQEGMINNAAMDNNDDEDDQQQQQLPNQQQRVIGAEILKLQEKLQSPDFLSQYESAYTQYQQQLQEAEQHKEGGQQE